MNDMIKIVVFFVICIKLGIFTQQNIEPSVTFSLDKSRITKFPWMLIISNTTSIISYGSLIHPRAVLTLELHDLIPTANTFLKVYANCYFKGHGILFNYKQDCSTYRIVSTFNILEEYQETNTNKVAILTLSKPFILNADIGVISLNQWDRDISKHDCGILSIRVLKAFGLRATFFSLIQVILLHNRTNINLLGQLTPPHLVLYNAMGEESYQEYDNSEFELKFPGSPLVCKSTRRENFFQYVQVGIVNITFKKYKHDGLSYFQSFGEVVRIDETIINMQQLFNKIIEFA